MEGLDEQSPSKRVKVSVARTGEQQCLGDVESYMDCPPEAEGDNEFVGPNCVIRKEEYVRIMAKALQSLGYKKIGGLLEKVSGIQLHTPPVTSFVEHILNGKWEKSLATLRENGLPDEDMIKQASVMILEQRIFELLDEERTEDAYKTLISEGDRLSLSEDRVKALLYCLLDTPKMELRSQLLVKLQKVFPPSVLIAEDRLLHLLERNIEFQRGTCRLPNASVEELSLLSDHHCHCDILPTYTSQVLKEHDDQVLFLQFSNDGEHLASASRDAKVIVWEVKAAAGNLVIFKHKLEGHESPVSFISWSPDNKELLSCGVEEVIRCWDVQTGECLYIYKKDNFGMVSCGWAPNGESFFAGVTDNSIIRFALDGNELQAKDQLETTIEISNLGILNQGLVLVYKENGIVAIDLTQPVAPNVNPYKVIVEDEPVTSFTLSHNRKYLLVNLLGKEIHLWTIDSDSKLIAVYRGYRGDQMPTPCVPMSSCVGGRNQSFVAGSLGDKQVYIWARNSSELIKTLAGHTRTVNSVSWNPVRPYMLASASDDRTIRIWSFWRHIEFVTSNSFSDCDS